jgi:hypothetical protein
MSVLSKLGYVRVNREAKHAFWRDLYRAQGPKRFIFSCVFIFLFCVATLLGALIVFGVIQ